MLRHELAALPPHQREALELAYFEGLSVQEIAVRTAAALGTVKGRLLLGRAKLRAALSPAIAIVLRDMGLADRIVGRHGWDLTLDESIPVCGDQAGLDYESLLRVRPTHVLLEWGSARPLPKRLHDLAARHAWRVESYELLTLAQIEDAARALAAEFGGVEGSAGGALVERLAAGFAHRGNDLAGVGRVLMLMSCSPPIALGPGSAHHELLVRVGGTPAIERGAAYITLNVEDVLRMSPEAILYTGTFSSSRKSALGMSNAVAKRSIPSTVVSSCNHWYSYSSNSSASRCSPYVAPKLFSLS